jgi:hypothetical protein
LQRSACSKIFATISRAARSIYHLEATCRRTIADQSSLSSTVSVAVELAAVAKKAQLKDETELAAAIAAKRTPSGGRYKPGLQRKRDMADWLAACNVVDGILVRSDGASVGTQKVLRRASWLSTIASFVARLPAGSPLQEAVGQVRGRRTHPRADCSTRGRHQPESFMIVVVTSISVRG